MSTAIVDLTGERFGKLKVLSLSGRRNKITYWNCECECGVMKEVPGDHIKTTRSCGCLRKPNLLGRRFGRMVVISAAKTEQRIRYWICKCDCGTIKKSASTGLIKGEIKSCGCLRRERFIEDLRTNPLRNATHHLTRTKVYKTWQSLKQRCQNPNNASYKYYGARGIKVCKRWSDFENFLKDMGMPPSKEHSIDRINSNGNYAPKNCRWANELEQHSNTRSNRLISFQGETLHMREWARRYSINSCTLSNRLDRGWNVEKALKHPIRKTLKTYS